MRTKIFLIILVFLITGSLTYMACEMESYGDLAIKDAQKILEQFNIGKLEQEQGKYLEGEVQITAVKDDGIYVKVTMPNSDKTENFRLQMENIENVSYNKDINKAQVLFFRDLLIINSLEETLRLQFTLNNDTKIEGVKAMKFDNIYNGYGLAYYESSEIESRYVKPTCGCEGSHSEKDCDSGGYGSTSCSVNNGQQSCSVSCGGTTHACCNN